MPHITFNGNISPGVWLSFKGNKLADAHPAADDSFVYHIENECLFHWDIVFNTGARVHTLTRSASRANSYFNDEANTYVNPSVNADILNEILDAKDAGTLTVTMTCKTWYHKFFRHILQKLRRTDPDLENFANPSNAAEIEASAPGRRGRYSYVKETKEIKDIPAELSGFRVVPPSSGSGAPTVKLFIYLKVKEALPEAEANEVTEIFLASDYSKINKYGSDRGDDQWDQGPASLRTIEKCLRTWEKNVWQYFLNYADLLRGNTIFNEIAMEAEGAEAAGGDQATVIMKVRDEIDKYIVTANHWGQRREDPRTEPYQFHVRGVFGSIHQSRWRASPVRILRLIDGHTFPLSPLHAHGSAFNMSEYVHFILQMGAGHCGEHSCVSFNMLQDLHDNGMAALLKSFVKTGNANIDHAFVVGGIRPTEVVETTASAANNSASDVGDSINLWDLRGALAAAGAGVDGYVCDPYLGPSEIAQTARGLLAGLNNSGKRSRRKDTDYLSFGGVHPSAPTLTRRTVPSVRNV